MFSELDAVQAHSFFVTGSAICPIKKKVTL